MLSTYPTKDIGIWPGKCIKGHAMDNEWQTAHIDPILRSSRLKAYFWIRCRLNIVNLFSQSLLRLLRNESLINSSFRVKRSGDPESRTVG